MAITVTGTLGGLFTQGGWSVADDAHPATLYFNNPLCEEGATCQYQEGGTIELEYELLLDPVELNGQYCGAHLVRVLGYRR